MEEHSDLVCDLGNQPDAAVQQVSPSPGTAGQTRDVTSFWDLHLLKGMQRHAPQALLPGVWPGRKGPAPKAVTGGTLVGLITGPKAEARDQGERARARAGGQAMPGSFLPCPLWARAPWRGHTNTCPLLSAVASHFLLFSIEQGVCLSRLSHIEWPEASLRTPR